MKMPKGEVQFHLSGVELDKWRSIAKGAVAMISVMHRNSGLWPYPPIRKEVDQYFKGSAEQAFSNGEDGSFTVTYAALLALRELSQQYPSRFRYEVARKFKSASHVRGAWGNSFDGRTRPGSIVASARHTAFAVLTLCELFPEFDFIDSDPSIRWLLEQQSAKTGGWKYRQDDEADQAFTTAACVAALACYVVGLRKHQSERRGRESDRGADEELVPAARIAVNEGLKRLFDMMSAEGLWRGHLDEENDLSGSANILDLVSVVEVLEVADDEMKLTGKIRAIRRTLAAAQRRRGWPPNLGVIEPGLASTVQVLLSLFDYLMDDERDIDHQNLAGVLAHIADDVIRNEGGQRLDSWDWMMLARLCALILTRTEGALLPEHEVAEVFRAAESLKQNSKSKLAQLAILSSYPFYEPWDKNIVYLVSRGRPKGWKSTIVAFRLFLSVVPVMRKFIQRYVERKIDRTIGIAS